MPANINFTEFTNREVVWANVAAINTFFETITISDATSDTPGVVKQATMPGTVTATTIEGKYYNINVMEEDGSTSVYPVALRETMDTVRTRLKTLEDAFNVLRANMITAGSGKA